MSDPSWQKWCPARDVVVSAIKGQALWELGEKDTFIVPDYFQNLERNTEDWVLMIMRPINGFPHLEIKKILCWGSLEFELRVMHEMIEIWFLNRILVPLLALK